MKIKRYELQRAESMNVTDFLFQIDELLNGKGDAFDIGCTESELQYLCEKWRDNPTSKGVCAVRNWQWWDLELPEDEVLPDGMRPALMYASDVIMDYRSRFEPGTSVRSTLLTELHDGCVFETQNTLYILVGPGCRKLADPKVMGSIIF